MQHKVTVIRVLITLVINTLHNDRRKGGFPSFNIASLILFIGTSLVITQHPVAKSIKEGRKLSLFCSARGKPKPRIKWKRNGRTIAPDLIRIRIKPTQTGSRLKIRNAVPQDSGDYHCVAKNLNGHISSTKARVEVKSEYKLKQESRR